MILEPEKIVTMPLDEMWRYFKRMKNQLDRGNKELVYNNVRKGIKIKFELDDFITNNVTHKPKSGMIRIRNTWHTYSDVYTEIEERERELTDFLLLNVKETGIVE